MPIKTVEIDPERTLELPTTVKLWPFTSFLEKNVKFDAKMVSHGR